MKSAASMSEGDDSDCAFVQKMLQHQAAVYRCLLSMVGDYSDAEDLVQQTMTTVWQKRSECSIEGLLPWAISIAKNHARNHRRKSERQNTAVGLDEESLDQVAAAQQRQLTESDSRRIALEGCLDQLSEEQRTLIEEHYDQQMSPGELAAVHSKNVEAVYKTLQRIRRVLFDCINTKMKEVTAQ